MFPNLDVRPPLLGECLGEAFKKSLTLGSIVGILKGVLSTVIDGLSLLSSEEEDCSLSTSCFPTIGPRTLTMLKSLSAFSCARLIEILRDGFFYMIGGGCLTENRLLNPSLRRLLISFDNWVSSIPRKAIKLLLWSSLLYRFSAVDLRRSICGGGIRSLTSIECDLTSESFLGFWTNVVVFLNCLFLSLFVLLFPVLFDLLLRLDFLRFSLSLSSASELILLDPDE